MWRRGVISAPQLPWQTHTHAHTLFIGVCVFLIQLPWIGTFTVSGCCDQSDQMTITTLLLCLCENMNSSVRHTNEQVGGVCIFAVWRKTAEREDFLVILGTEVPETWLKPSRYIPLTSFSARQHICKCCDISAAQVSDFSPILNYQQPLKYSTPPPHPAKKKELIKQFIHTKGRLSPFKIWAEMSAHFFPPDRKCYEASPNIILLLMYSVILL